MPNGVDRRAEIDAETAKSLLLINGAGVFALLAFLPTILGKPGCEPLARAALWGVMILVGGLASVVVHSHLRRRCSLHYEHHSMNPPKGRLLGVKLWAPTVCCASQVFMWLSLAALIFAAVYVAAAGIVLLGDAPSATCRGD